MDNNNHRDVIAELDALAQQVTRTIRRFEAAGMTSIMKDDYVALHAMEHHIMEMRHAHAHAIAQSDIFPLDQDQHAKHQTR